MKIMVTGGAGNIGRSAVDRLVRQGHEVVAIVLAPSVGRDDGSLLATREVIGDASDVGVVNEAMEGADAVLHLAAIPAPVGYTARELLLANALTTMTVLEAAGERSVTSVVLASSISILGMAWGEHMMHPLALPIDESHPIRATEGYALSKEHDEATARMAARRWGIPIVALRFPFTATAATIRARAADPAQAATLAKELWAYLDVRDAARACEAALVESAAGRVPGATVLNVMADDVVLDRPFAELLAEWHPDAVSLLAGRELAGGYDTSRARALLGFSAEHLLDHAV